VPGAFTVAVAAALVVWASAAGSGGRPAAFVSAAGALAGLVVVTSARGARGAIGVRSGTGLVLIVVTAATSIVVARTGGIADDVASAIATAAAVIVVGGAAMGIVGRWRGTPWASAGDVE
jgi:hypothetical protein